MEMKIIARINPGDIFQVARGNGLSFSAAERANKLQYVELDAEFNDHGDVVKVEIAFLGMREPPPNMRLGWPFKPCADRLKEIRGA